jgi:autotransporter-associated beta strand protein
VKASGTLTPTFSESGDPLPQTIKFDPATGLLSGTPGPGDVGTYHLTVTASNSLGAGTPQHFTLTITNATDTWTGNGKDGNWSNFDNWSDGIPRSGDNLVFPADAAKRSNCIDDIPGLSINNIEIDGIYDLTATNAAALTVLGNVTVNPGPITPARSTIGIPVTLAGRSDTVTVNQGATLAITDALAGGDLVKAGAGELDLMQDNNYVGNTTLQAGTLGLGTPKALGTGALIVNGAAPMALTRPVAISGAEFAVDNEIDLVQGTLSVPAGIWAFTGSVVVKGDTEIDPVSGGTVRLRGAVTTPVTLNFLSVGGTRGSSVFELGGSLDQNTVVIVNPNAQVNVGSTLAGTGTIAVDGTLISNSGNSFDGKIFLHDKGTIQLIDNQYFSTAPLLGTARLTVFAAQSTPAVVQTVKQATGASFLGLSTYLNNPVEIDASKASPPTAGLKIMGPLGLTGSFKMDTPCELEVAANSSLILTGTIAGGPLTVKGPGKLKLGGTLSRGSEVAVVADNAVGPGMVELLDSFQGGGTVTVNGGKLLSNATNGYAGLIDLRKGSIEVGASDALGTATLAVNAGARGLASIQGPSKQKIYLANAVDIQNSAVLAVGANSDLVLTMSQDLDADWEIDPAAGAELLFLGDLSGPVTLKVAGDGEVDLWGNLSLSVVRAVPHGTVRLLNTSRIVSGRVEAAGGTLIMDDQVGNKPVSFTPQAGTTLSNLRPVPDPSGHSLPPGVNFPVGFFDFEIRGLNPGGSSTVTITLPNVFVNQYYIYGSKNGIDPPDWYLFDYDSATGTGAKITHNVNGNVTTTVITLYFVDGKRGDNDLAANGIIVDPGAPAVEVLSPNQRYVTQLYRDILHREAEAGGMTSWSSLLDQGASRFLVARGIWESPEHRGLQVDQLYAGILHRPADAPGRAGWINALLRGMSETGMTRLFLTSAEYTATHATAASYVQGVFADVLGRPVDPVGFADGMQAAELPGGRVAVAQAVLISSEAMGDLVNRAYTELLHRSPDAAGARYWLSLITRRVVSPDLLGEKLLSSNEYYAAAPE